jgi:two-component system, NarL family, response regulator
VSEETVVRVLLVDDHAVVREGVEGLIRKESALTVVASVGSGAEAIEVCRMTAVDVVLLDLKMPDMDGLETLRRLREEHPRKAIVILTSDDRDESLRRAMEAGASGFLPKSVRGWDLVQALLVVARTGRLPLSPDMVVRLRNATAPGSLTAKEREILRELARGASNEEISVAVGVSVNTVKTHVNNILGKLGATSRTEAVVKALRNGLVELD